ncbi:hypothetical protein SYNPS1DRAFT_28266, partial [Syncephalis pseudoplumigaleata]
EYDVYDELEARGLCDTDCEEDCSDDGSLPLDEDRPAFAAATSSHHSLLSLLSSSEDYDDDDDDDDDDDESMDYFDLEEAAELAGVPFPQSSPSLALLSRELMTTMGTHKAQPLAMADAWQPHTSYAVAFPKPTTAAAAAATATPIITYHRDVALGCISPPQSPDIALPQYQQQQNHHYGDDQQQTSKHSELADSEHGFAAHLMMTTDHASDASSRPDGYAGDAWQTWGDPVSQVNHDWINSLSTDAMDADDDDDRYSPSDDWIYGAYGISKI